MDYLIPGGRGEWAVRWQAVTGIEILPGLWKKRRMTPASYRLTLGRVGDHETLQPLVDQDSRLADAPLILRIDRAAFAKDEARLLAAMRRYAACPVIYYG